MSKFTIGDRVLINEKGFARYGFFDGTPGRFGNPKCEGIVAELTGYGVRVAWDNGTKNSYDNDTLDLVVTSLENE